MSGNMINKSFICEEHICKSCNGSGGRLELFKYSTTNKYFMICNSCRGKGTILIKIKACEYVGHYE